MIKRCWLEQTKTAYRTCESVLESAQLHVKNLHQHREYLARLRYGGNCSACLLEPWTHTLPCKHGLCTLCLRACDGKETDGCRIIVNECPVCELSVGSRCIRKFIPPTATLRVLALDGGGVKGLVQLQVLQYLCDEIGLRDTVHISTFFDLMVGSSIGGICALGLGTRKWSLEECRMKFLKFTEQIFAPKSCFGRLLSRFTGGWFAILSNVAKLIFFDSIYDSAPIETILQESFGETSLMIQSDLEHPTRVAVVVNQASTSGPTVFANYNKSRHSKNGAYMWPAMDSLYRSLKIWEVARATSAAPGFWDTITLLGSAYQDGGLSHNNPSAIAISEANVL
ncbi:FabD/lysophospholipase-like protein, partial [Aureobasidium melanogenum CBS 110374]